MSNKQHTTHWLVERKMKIKNVENKQIGGILLVIQLGSQCKASYRNRPKVQVLQNVRLCSSDKEQIYMSQLGVQDFRPDESKVFLTEMIIIC